MLNTERLAVAAHLHNALRRKLGRVTDVEWMAQDDAYARAIVRLALGEVGATDLHVLALRLQATLPAASAGSVSNVAQVVAQRAAPGAPPRYVRSLR